MKTPNSKYFLLFLMAIFFTASVFLYADPDGRTGRTRKSSTSGCGGCHGSSATTGVTVTVNGPDSVDVGQTIQYSLTINRSTQLGAGLDIAVRRGTLSPVSSTIHLASGELTHNADIPMTSGTVTVLFNYIAPATIGTDTIWATGLASNSNGGSSGDEWNWSPSKRVIVKLPTGIENISTVSDFSLSQNYPNPFNPLTSIKLELSKPMDIKVRIFDNTGNEIEVLHDGKLNAGQHLFKWDAAKYPSGVYYYKTEGNDFSTTKKMMLVK